jgi:hypothetical protein
VNYWDTRKKKCKPTSFTSSFRKGEKKKEEVKEVGLRSQSSARESGAKRRKKAAGIMSRDGKCFFVFGFK